jgi:hypothetical protein
MNLADCFGKVLRPGRIAAVWLGYAARVQIALGDCDRGLDLLTRAIDGEAIAIFYKDQPLWEPIRRGPRFQSLLRRMHVPTD